MKFPPVLYPLRYRTFRLLWLGMGASYAGDTLQTLAQGWLVAGLTGSSATAVGLIGVMASIPQLLMPVGGVIAEGLDRRRMLIAGQLAGAAAALGVGALVVSGRIAPWHIYLWAVFSGCIWLVSRPSYKVVLTQAVPRDLVRPAVALNSMGETFSLLLVNGLGSVLLSVAGLPVAFVLNALSYAAAGISLWLLPELGNRPDTAKLSLGGVTAGLWEGLRYLFGKPALLYPLLLTTITTMAVSPAFGLLAAVVHQQGGSIVTLGVLGASGSLGSFLGAIYAGSRGDGSASSLSAPVQRYAIHGLGAAVALGLFALIPVGALTVLPMAVIGFLLFSEAVWNTSRVRQLAEEAFQARIQSITTMAFTIGGALGQLWGGPAYDRLGMLGVGIAAGVLAALCIGVWLTAARARTVQSHVE